MRGRRQARAANVDAIWRAHASSVVVQTTTKRRPELAVASAFSAKVSATCTKPSTSIGSIDSAAALLSKAPSPKSAGSVFSTRCVVSPRRSRAVLSYSVRLRRVRTRKGTCVSVVVGHVAPPEPVLPVPPGVAPPDGPEPGPVDPDPVDPDPVEPDPVEPDPGPIPGVDRGVPMLSGSPNRPEQDTPARASIHVQRWIAASGPAVLVLFISYSVPNANADSSRPGGAFHRGLFTSSSEPRRV